MRKLLSLLAVAVLTGAVSLVAQAADDTKITGMAQCAKCALGEAKECQNVVVVKDGDKETTYYFVMNEVAKAAHGKLGFCSAKKGEGPSVAAEGTCEEKDGKFVFTATKIEEAKK
jgi:hypothetical protein